MKDICRVVKEVVVIKVVVKVVVVVVGNNDLAI